jgi:hypothetical protein
MEKICENCKHWKEFSNRPKEGFCYLSKARHPMMHSGCGLYTKSDFGCILFDEKPLAVKVVTNVV